MSGNFTRRTPARTWRLGMGGALLVAGTLLDHCTVAAPTVIANPVPEQPLQTQDQLDTPSEMDVFQPTGVAPEKLPEIFQYGPLQLHPHASYRFLYGSGIQSTPGDQQQTAIQELSPGFMADLGPHWAFDYTPTFRFYSSDKFKDGVDHSVSLTGSQQYEGWVLGLSHNTQVSSAPTVETGAQTDQSTHTTGLTASHDLNSAISTDLGVNQTINLVSGYQNSYDWSTLDWINYKFTPRLNAGIGAGGGYVLLQSNGTQAGGQGDTDQTFEQLQARVNWRLTEKVSLQVSGGLEDRQFQTAGTGDSLEPIFSVALQYQPFAATQISLNANRTVASSDFYLAAQETETTYVGINLNQRLLRKFNLGVGVSYAVTDYSAPAADTTANMENRSDDVVNFNARLSHPFFKHGTWSVFYQYSENTSSTSGFGYQSNQTGFEISYSF